jgi:CubicO group peptidase (beta-lactamase class C family)
MLNVKSQTTMFQSQQVMESWIARGDFAGGALIAVRDGRVVQEYYVGDAAPERAASSGTLWPLASISKVYSVTMVMRLIEMGVLSLNMHVRHLFPQFVGGGRENIMLRHLLTHTSGLIYESPHMEARLAAQIPMEALIEEAFTAPLLFQPGSSMSYADYNTLLVGHMAATATGRPFAELVEQLVFEPMGLRDTHIRPAAAHAPHIAHVRTVMAEGTPGAMYNSTHARGLAHPAFGVLATVSDLMRFLQHFAPGGPRILREATVQAMTRDMAGGVRGHVIAQEGRSPVAPAPWGLGWGLQTEHTPGVYCDLASNRTFGHGGASGCWCFVDPEANIAVAVVSNTHLRAGRDAWTVRLKTMVNAAYAEVAN